MALKLKSAGHAAPVVVGMFVLMTWPVAAADGILIVQKATMGTNTQTNQIQIEKTRIRAENANPSGDKQAFIFDSTKQVIWIVNYDKKAYSEITKADIDRIGAQVNDAMAQMRERMANLPPEQRAQVEAMMRGRGMPIDGPPPKPEYKKVGTDTVGKWTCDRYDAYVDNRKAAELCTVQPQAFGATLADFEIARQLAAFLSRLMPPGTENLLQIGLEAQGFSGVPVRHVTLGPIPMTTEVTSVIRQSFPDSAFAVPAGFEKTEIPFGGRGRGRQ